MAGAVYGSEVSGAAPSGVARPIITALIAGFYAWCLVETYKELSELWGYLGFWYRPQPAFVTWSTIGASSLLGLLLPTHNWTVVGFTKWVLYFILFIPGLMIPAQQGVLPTNDLILLTALIWLSSALFIVLLRDGKPFPPIRLAANYLWIGVITTWFLGNALVIYVFGDTMSIADLNQVYEQRSAAGELGGAAMTYLTGLLSGAINPFLIVIGIARRKPALVFLGLFGQVLIYATLAGKVVLGSTMLTIGAFLAFSNGRVVFTRVYAAVLTFAVLGPFLSSPRALGGEWANTLSDLIYMRILVLPGVLVGVYSDFFRSFPVTYLSHSLIGRPFSTYPYGSESVGQVIGRYVTPTIGAANNYNANFIAADGIAGFSTWGVPAIFVLAAGWLWFMSRLVGQTERPIACAMLMPFVVSLADSSLFTAILTGGGAAAALLLYLNRSITQSGAMALLPESEKAPSAYAAMSKTGR